MPVWAPADLVPDFWILVKKKRLENSDVDRRKRKTVLRFGNLDTLEYLRRLAHNFQMNKIKTYVSFLLINRFNIFYFSIKLPF